jgi:SAM-dependent methyltransferase
MQKAKMFDAIKKDLQTAYNQRANFRNNRTIQSWKIEERAHFLTFLKPNQAQTLLEIGAGTGQDSLFFQEHGFVVTATDLSPTHVAYCRQKNLNALVMDTCDLQFPDNNFDAVFSLNCLLHIPPDQLPTALAEIRRVLKSDGFFFLGVHGGYEYAGIWKSDNHTPKRYFSFKSDQAMNEQLATFFDILSFKPIHYGDEDDANLHFQSFILKNNKGGDL